MKHPVLTIATAGVVLAMASVYAQAADPGQGSSTIERMDTNRDGTMSREESRKAHTEREQERNREEPPGHADMDTNHDGRVSHEEFQAYEQKRQQQRAQEREKRQQEYQQRHEKRTREREQRQQEMQEQQQQRYEETHQWQPGQVDHGGGPGGGRR